MKSKSKSKPVSQQRKWQIQQLAKGNCQICGKKRRDYAILCNKHQQIKRDRQRERAAEKRKAKARKSKLDRARRVAKKVAAAVQSAVA